MCLLLASRYNTDLVLVAMETIVNKYGKKLIYLSFTSVTLALLLLVAGTGSGIATPLPAQPEPTTVWVYLPLLVRVPAPTPSPTPTPSGDVSVEAELLALINAERTSRGLPPLVQASELTQAARRHSQDMANNNFFSHTGSDGSTAGERISDAGYNWWTYGEIIAAGYPDAESAVAGWMNSPGHRAIILSEAYTEFGAGYATNPSSNYTRYYTVDFGTRR